MFFFKKSIDTADSVTIETSSYFENLTIEEMAEQFAFFYEGMKSLYSLYESLDKNEYHALCDFDSFYYQLTELPFSISSRCISEFFDEIDQDSFNKYFQQRNENKNSLFHKIFSACTLMMKYLYIAYLSAKSDAFIEKLYLLKNAECYLRLIQHCKKFLTSKVWSDSLKNFETYFIKYLNNALAPKRIKSLKDIKKLIKAEEKKLGATFKGRLSLMEYEPWEEIDSDKPSQSAATFCQL